METPSDRECQYRRDTSSNERIMRRLTLALILAIAHPMSYGASSAPYLKALYAYSLGASGKPEFYEAHVVLSDFKGDARDLVDRLRSICSEFPKLDTYLVRVFSSDRAARVEYLGGLGRKPTNAPDWFASEFVAEILPKGEVVLSPMQQENRRIQKINVGWCRG